MDKYRKSLLLCTSFCCLLVSAAGLDLYSSYQRDQGLAEFQLKNVTSLVAEWIKGAMLNTDYVLRDIVSRVPADDLHFPASDTAQQRALTALIVAKKNSLPNAAGVGLTGTDCILTHTSAQAGVDVSAREWCKAIFQPGAPDNFISHMYLNRAGRPSVTQVRRISSTDGKPAGSAGISVDLTFFSNWLHNISTGPDDVLLIADTWYSVLASSNAHSGQPGRALPQAVLQPFVSGGAAYTTLRSAALGDGVARLYAIRKVERLPFFVVYGIPDRDWQASWRRQTVLELLAVFLICAMVFGMLRVYRTQLLQEARLQHLANTDSLTGVINRRHFMEQAAQELGRAHSSAQELALMIVDIDHFKPINDGFGHAVGDQAVRVFADACRAELRDIDLLGRLGGDEFVVLLPGSSLTQAAAVAERMRAVIAADRTLVERGFDIRMTASIGVARLAPDAADISAALAQADAALYRAKQQGRNRIEITSGS